MATAVPEESRKRMMMRIRDEADGCWLARSRESGRCGLYHQVNVMMVILQCLEIICFNIYHQVNVMMVILQCLEIICFNIYHQDGGPPGFPSMSSKGEWITGRRSPGGWEVMRRRSPFIFIFKNKIKI